MTLFGDRTGQVNNTRMGIRFFRFEVGIMRATKSSVKFMSKFELINTTSICWTIELNHIICHHQDCCWSNNNIRC
jgi:hypothetical protein